jgi:pimeloyl-ACP methyl ester carboxylesterase
MIHGDALDARLWDGQFAFFARERAVLRYDVRGFGRSDPPGAEAYADVDDLKALLEYFDIDSAHLLGLSMGGGSPPISR